jgi:hypothetical protein
VTLVHVNLLQNKPKMQLAIQTRRFLSLLLLLLLFPDLKQAGDRCSVFGGSSMRRSTVR